jgi:ABC-type sulfate/molybdate transport systems ATPase subunit
MDLYAFLFILQNIYNDSHMNIYNKIGFILQTNNVQYDPSSICKKIELKSVHRFLIIQIVVNCSNT